MTKHKQALATYRELILFVGLLGQGMPASALVYSTAGTFTWTAPAGVTSINVECWGAGGAGGAITAPVYLTSGGGGGGAYVKTPNYGVTPATGYSVVVGAGGSGTGGDSYFVNDSTIMAKGGGSPATNFAGFGSGGSAANSVGATKFSGGSGYFVNGAPAGGGGSSAGTASNGNPAFSFIGGTAVTGGGGGGNGATSMNTQGQTGSKPGGGGGGSHFSGIPINGAQGAAGQVRITYNQTIGAITFSPATLTYKGVTTASATATSGLAVSFSSLTPSVCTASGTNGATITNLTFGVCTIAADQAGNTDYTAAAQVTQSLTLNTCGDGITLPVGPPASWAQLALPCVPSASPASVANVLGAGTTGQLTAANYNSANYNTGSNWWRVFRRDAASNAYVLMPKDGTSGADLLGVGSGYWLKSLDAPVGGGKLEVTGTATATDVTQAQGCASANGCKAISLTAASGQTRANLVGNPFPYAIDWSQVRIRINGSSTTYTPCQAAGLGAGAGCSGPAASPAVLSNVVSIWNGADYDSFTDLTGNQGNLQYFKSFWVKVLPGAFGQTVELLIPAQVSTLTQAAPISTELPWYLAWLDWLAAPAQAAPPEKGDWWVRLKLNNEATGWQSGTVRLGQLGTAQAGYDPNDVPKMAPFATPYLSLVVPHPEWGAQAGDYASDFRPRSRQPMDWILEVRADPLGGVASLTWQGDPAILKRSRLVDLQTGKTLQPTDRRWVGKGYPITLGNTVQRYQWRYLGN